MFETLARVMTDPLDTLKIQCQACDHRTVWSRQIAFAMLGADTSPNEARRRLICKKCGHRVMSVTI
jgi:DNA-directed RNA polymerase subunit RPC12/RpoP